MSWEFGNLHGKQTVGCSRPLMPKQHIQSVSSSITILGDCPCWQPRAAHRWPPRWPWHILWWPGVDQRWPPVGKISCWIQNIAKIVTRTCINFVDTPAFASALSAFVICLFCRSAIFVLQHYLHRDSRTHGAKIVLIAAELLECRSNSLKI